MDLDTVLWLCPSTINETLKWLSSLPVLKQETFCFWQRSDRYIISLFPHLHIPFLPFSPSLKSLMVSVDVKHHVYLLRRNTTRPEQGRIGSISGDHRSFAPGSVNNFLKWGRVSYHFSSNDSRMRVAVFYKVVKACEGLVRTVPPTDSVSSESFLELQKPGKLQMTYWQCIFWKLRWTPETWQVTDDLLTVYLLKASLNSRNLASYRWPTDSVSPESFLELQKPGKLQMTYWQCIFWKLPWTPEAWQVTYKTLTKNR